MSGGLASGGGDGLIGPEEELPLGQAIKAPGSSGAVATTLTCALQTQGSVAHRRAPATWFPFGRLRLFGS